jgi:hypothetical protein
MLIVCTQDEVVRNWAQNPLSGSNDWGAVIALPAGPQQNASQAFLNALRALDRNEPLCLSAHGNDTEIGDSGHGPNDWGWDTEDIAELLRLSVPNHYSGPVLCSVCSETVANFSAGLVVALERARALNGVWIYGYNRPVPSNAHFPAPNELDRKVDLQGTQVNYEDDLLAKGA